MPLAVHTVRQPEDTGVARRASPAIAVPDRRNRPLRTGMRFDPLMPIDRWKVVGARLAAYSDAASWWLGDWLAFGQAKYGRRYKEGIALTGLEYQTLRNYATVARRFDVSRRRDNLSFQHHAEVCALSDEDQDHWLDQAAAPGWSKSELRRRVRAATARGPVEARSAVLRLVIGPRRAQQWREAASRDDCALDAWVMQMADEAAASSALGEARVQARDQNARADLAVDCHSAGTGRTVGTPA
jgi:hypothetical protein